MTILWSKTLTEAAFSGKGGLGTQPRSSLGDVSMFKMRVGKSHVRAGPALIQVKENHTKIDHVSSYYDA